MTIEVKSAPAIFIDGKMLTRTVIQRMRSVCLDARYSPAITKDGHLSPSMELLGWVELSTATYERHVYIATDSKDLYLFTKTEPSAYGDYISPTQHVFLENLERVLQSAVRLYTF